MTIMRRFSCCLALAFMLWGWPEYATALDQGLDVSQYAHRAWRNSEGFARTVTFVFAQTPDGYLWQGTALGLTRFDGVQNKPWHPPAGASLPDIRISALLVSRDGTLWIGTMGGLASWDGHKFITYPRFRDHVISSLAQDRDGVVWVAGGMKETGFICAIRSVTTTKCFGEDGSLGPFLGPLCAGSDGSLWVGTAKGLWHRTPGAAAKFYSFQEPEDAHRVAAMYARGSPVVETVGGAILTLTQQGIRQIVNGEIRPYSDQPELAGASLHTLFGDRDDALWVGTFDHGLLRYHQGRVDSFGRADGLSGDKVNKLFEDREGNMWAATRGGIDRFSPLSVTAYSSRQGLTGSSSSVLAADDGSIWTNTTSGLYRWRDGRMFVYRGERQHTASGPSAGSSQDASAEEVIISGLPPSGVASLFQDRSGRIWLGAKSAFGYLKDDRFTAVHGIPDGFVDSITEDNSGNLWLASREGGLLRLSSDLAVHRVPSTGPLETGRWWRLAGDPVHGGVWMGSFFGGVAHVVNDRVQEHYSAAEGLGKGAVHDLRVSPDGSVWAATDGGVTRIADGHISTLDSKSGLPCDAATATIEDNDGATWIYTACGLVRITRSDLDSWAAAAKQALVQRAVRATVLDESDGVLAYNNLSGTPMPHLSRARDGRLWFSTVEGVAVVDPRHLRLNTVPPPVHVEQIIADRKSYDLSSQIRLPPLQRDLQIDYTALSFVAPEKIRFRYKLEGRDPDWQEAGNRRQAFYSDLSPGNYRFRVIASNNSGVWNEEGAALAFSIAPAYWQTNWFLALCATALALLLWGAYRIRLRQLAHEREVEHRQRELQMELAHANRVGSVGQLTASITHEIRQPITSVLGSAYAARRWLDQSDLEEVRQTIEHMITAATKAGDIITGLRALVNKAPARIENLDMNEAIREVLVITRGEATKNNVSVATDLAVDLPLVQGDRVQLQQVILNLVINAIEAMSGMADGPRDLLIKTAISEPESVAVIVKDTGPGLDPEHAVRAFEAFYTTKPQGLGMGLVICRSITEAHGGKIEVTANVPRGAIFRFTLPIRCRTAQGS